MCLTPAQAQESTLTKKELARVWPRRPDLEPFEDALKAAVQQKDHLEEALERYLQGNPNARGSNLAHLMRGLHLYRKGDYAKALRDLQAVTVPHGATAQFFAAECLFHQGLYAEALAVYKKIKAPSLWQHRAQMRKADCALALNQRTAVSLITSTLTTYPEYPHQASAYFAIAEAEQRAGHLQKAAQALYRVQAHWPGDPLVQVANQKLELLAKQGVYPSALSAQDQYNRAADLRLRKYYTEAEAAFAAIADDRKQAARLRTNARIQQGRTLMQMERFEDALKVLEPVAKTAAKSFQEAANGYLYETYKRLGRNDDAANAYLKSLGEDPKKPSVAAQKKVALLYFDQGEYEKADKILQKTGRKGVPIRLDVWLDYRMGRYDIAAQGFTRLTKAGSNRNRATYWLARTREKQGQTDVAHDLYREVIRQWPHTYYAHLSSLRLDRPFPNETPKTDLSVNRTAAELLNEVGESAGQAFPGYIEAAELSFIGEARLANLTLRRADEPMRAIRNGSSQWMEKPFVDNRKPENQRLEWGLKTDRRSQAIPGKVRAYFRGANLSEVTEKIRNAYLKQGDFYNYRRMLSGSLRPGGDPNASSNYDWFNFYPLAFKELIEPWSRERNIDPLLVWAFMTAESAYNPWAISHANARGLMQMMPQTGGLIADRMHLRDYGTALIFDPEIVVPMATWYIQALLEKFNGQLPLSIPSYNAGPHRVAVWLSLKGKLPMDEFVEEIPYDEAREYTKKVLRYYGYFRLIHQGQSNLPLRFELDTAFHDNINF